MVISLKAQNAAPLVVLVLVQAYLVLFLASGSFDIGGLLSKVETASTILVINIVLVWISYLLPADIKNGLVFCRYKNALPGHRFISLMKADPRINVHQIQAKYDLNDLVNDEKAQNSYWYRVFYKPNSSSIEILSAHRAYLLYRDACAVSVILFVAYCLLAWFLPVYIDHTAIQYGLVFIIFALGFCVAAQNAGKRMVTTAVAMSIAGSL